MAKSRTSIGLDNAALNKAAECLKSLAHPQRIKIALLLVSGRSYTVGELAEACELPQPQTSLHLRLMQRCGFLQGVRKGREVYYEICEPHLESMLACIQKRFGGSAKSA